MPLSFMYGKSITKKEGFSLDALPAHLLELQKKLDSWTTGYSIDFELTFKKFKELELIQPSFPGEMPIYFVSGEYRPEQLEMADFLALLSHPSPFFLFAEFAGKEYPNFEIFYRMRSPHIRGFDYYNPEIDSDGMHGLQMRPRVSATHESLELRKAFYEILRDEFELPSFAEVFEKHYWKSADGSFLIGSEIERPYKSNDIDICYTDTHVKSVNKVLCRLNELTDKIVSLRLYELTGTWETIRGFITNRRIKELFKLSKCGIDTVSEGRFGSIPDLTMDKVLEMLGQKSVCTRLALRCNNMTWKTSFSEIAEGTIAFSADRKMCGWHVNFLLDCNDCESDLFADFCREVRELTTLPFDKMKYWQQKAYEGKRHAQVIARIAEFYKQAQKMTLELIKEYLTSGRLPKENLAGYYDGGIGLFQKDEVKFNTIVKEEVSQRLPEFSYDKNSSDPLTGTVSFVRRDKDTGLLHYLTFGRDPSWRGKVFDINFTINKFPGMSAGGPWWTFWTESRQFTENLWWSYDTAEDLRETLACAFDFIEDMGERFFREVGELLLQHYDGISEEDSEKSKNCERA